MLRKISYTFCLLLVIGLLASQAWSDTLYAKQITPLSVERKLLIGRPLAFEVTIRQKNRDYYEKRGEAIWDLPTEKKAIALTFDDGPNESYTPQILELLEKYGVKSTFFTVGTRVQKNPKLAKQMVQQHHELANHTLTHPDMRRLSRQRIKTELESAQSIIQKTTGVVPTLFRPPGGSYNEKIVAAAKDMGYLVVMWSWHQDTKDWTNPGVQKIVNKVLRNVRNGDIILFHDHGGNRQQTVDALKIILPELKKRGYEMITVSELISIRNQYPVKANLPSLLPTKGHK
ncbi:polysaccharide deacetylase family protein [Brevibacillus laterosporus]|uniref:polysaccharide deacetylase family protein n=1 Tax=Brevibacillus laterosporus TaxID=1465 RepID=UPI000CE3F315|nr:polysaccharide deacetylase family protein [Brevibacillus laterosporus]PPA87752.1 polysaccharide deacetylase [Brevibacillus laterosporus]